MLRRLCLLAILLGLAACQSIQVDSDYDPHRDFAALQSWAWQEPAVQYRPDDPRVRSDLTEQRLREAIAQQLEQHGLRQAAPGTPADIRVQAFLIVDNRQQQVSTYYGGGYWGGMWGYPGYTEVRTLDYQVGTLQLDFLDHDGRLIWRGSAAQMLRRNPGSPQERAIAINKTVAKILARYPPQRGH
ncbi:DUF4136 domain-containing protein [Pseudomonas sp. MAP12]|uniref:DUF4136 domain-containing protein n=1 Tax=Geopseudomonas aromaticivorans TaxID=2849492 RepID=A0ABS6MYI0_9GAMM|nr:DUF4136 domain-containing protein [Pseudomonas aromaticivorans]MBV2133869.1 DUF4136 domain-containing protein [Pseudomonas aromaticivorans]